MSEAAEKILDEYEKKRSRKEGERIARIRKIYGDFPEIEDIDKEINLSGAENVEKILKNPEKAEYFNSKYREKVKNLNEKRAVIIKENGIDPHFDAVKYDCEKCSDTGFMPDGKKCGCFRKRLIDYKYNRSNLSEILERENFDTFSFDYYPDRKVEGHKLSPYENIREIYNRAKIFCENFDNEEKGLLFYGGTGLGKTFLSNCITKALTDAGKSVIYMSAPRLFIMYEDYRFNRLDDDEIIEDIYSADLLIIDDLGAENQSKGNVALLFDIMNERLLRGRKLLINTNFGMKELSEMYSSRFTSRIYEYFLVYGFYGDDIRIQKLKNR